MKIFSQKLLVAALATSLTIAGPASANAASACSPITKELKSSKLGKLYAYAVDLTTGKVLIDVRSNQQTPSASVMKTISAAAAIKFIVKPREVNQLQPYVATTSVLINPDEPGTLILRGGGDHSLTRVKSGSYTTYFSVGRHPAKLRELASAALAALPTGTLIEKIVLDDSFFKGPTWNPNHFRYSRTNGDMSPVTGLMVDSARKNPDQTDRNYSGKRVSDPTLQAGESFKSWLLAANDVNASKISAQVTLEKGSTPSNAIVIASKNSQPINNWITHALKISDNTETEIIARHTQLAVGLKNSYTSAQAMGNKLFSSLGINYNKLIMKDASGLAPNNRVTARLLVSLMQSASNPGSDIAALVTSMNTSGDGGSLANRFRAYDKKKKKYVLVIPKGMIRAKTGFIGGLYSLAGLVTTADQHTIAFAIFARRDSAHRKYVGTGTKDAIDNVVEKLYLCGPKL